MTPPGYSPSDIMLTAIVFLATGVVLGCICRVGCAENRENYQKVPTDHEIEMPQTNGRHADIESS